MKTKTGLFFGSFNPMHVGHLIIGSYMADFTDLKEVWFVVSPQNPFKQSKNLLNEYERLEMARLATEDDIRFKASDIEFFMSRPSYTIDTLLHLDDKYPNREFVLIMGTDNLETFHKWKNYEQILEHYHIYAYARPGVDSSKMMKHDSIQVFEDVPQMEISATFIRNAAKNKKSIQHFLPAKIWGYIERWGFYING